MDRTRRRLLKLGAAACAAAPLFAACQRPQGRAYGEDLYVLPPFGQVSLLHFSDSYAQLRPLYLHAGEGAADWLRAQPRAALAARFKAHAIAPDSAAAYAFGGGDFVAAATRFGRLGGYAHLATLIKSLRKQRTASLLLDGGSSLAGSAMALWSEGADMAAASHLLGVDALCGGAEFSFGAERLTALTKELGATEFLAQNIRDDIWGNLPFKPFTVRVLNGIPVAVVGQASPHARELYAHAALAEWRFGIDEEALQKTVAQARAAGARVVVLLSQQGLGADLKLASRVTGIDVIFGGVSDQITLAPMLVNNAAGRTFVINSGSHGRYLSVLDLDLKHGKLRDLRYKLLPVIADLIAADYQIAASIEKSRAPFKDRLQQPLAVTETLLTRQHPVGASWDELILQSMRAGLDVPIALSPGYRCGNTLLPGATITAEDVTGLAPFHYAVCSIEERTGEEIKLMLEAMADKTFNSDPYARWGQDMVRSSGLRYRLHPRAAMGARIGDLALADGSALQAGKVYKLASWGIGQPREGQPLTELIARYLEAHPRIASTTVQNVTLD